MGYPMAGHLKTAGYHVTVYNRTNSKSVAWVNQYGGSLGETPSRSRNWRRLWSWPALETMMTLGPSA